MPEVRTTTRRLGRSGHVAPPRTGRAPCPARRRGVGPTLTKRREARTIAQSINYVHFLVLSPVRWRSGRLPPRPPGPLRVWELCLGTASGDGSPFLGCCIGGEFPPLVSSFPFLLRAERRVFSCMLVCACGVCVCAGRRRAGGRRAEGQRATVQSQWLVALERGRGDGRSARGSRRQQGVRGSRHFVASALARAGLSRKVRKQTPGSVTHNFTLPCLRVCAPFLGLFQASPQVVISSRPRRGGGRARARSAVCVCVCMTATRDPSFSY